MRDTYSLYEAKARFSAIVRRVREGHHVIVTLHGEPVVEIRRIATEEGGLDIHMQNLVERGIVVRSESHPQRPRLVARRPGALKRFLADRDG